VQLISESVQAAPTQALLAHAAFKEKKSKLASRKQKDVLDKYGNASAGKVDDDLLLPSSEAYVEYDRQYAPLTLCFLQLSCCLCCSLKRI
jgi:Pre-mRNA splicing Prp18-interacting factor